jgi:hypothetical protein
MAVAAGKFEARAVFVDHAGWFDNPSLRNLAGVAYGAEWNEADQAVEGKIRLYSEAAPVANLLDEVLGDDQARPDIGLSMVFWPLWAPRDNDDKNSRSEDPRRIVEVRYIESVDLVFQPAADGRVLEALSAFSHRSQSEILSLNSGGLEMEGDKEHRENEVGSTPSTRTEVVTPEPVGSTPSTPTNGDAGQSQTSAQDWTAVLSATVAGAMLGSSGLPAASRERLAARSYASPGEVETAIAEERAYLAKLAESNVIQIGGQAPRGGSIQVGLNALEKVQLAAEALLSAGRPGQGVAPLSGVRELYVLLSGDYEMTGMFQPERIQFANVTSSTMANLVANVLNKRVVGLFQEYPRWWEPIVSVEDFGSLQQVKWITLGGVGELPTVAEGAAYTELTWDDKAETADFVKKGGYLGITLETIDKDDTRKVQAAPRALAQAAWLSLSKAVSSIFTSASGAGPTLADTGALFNSTAVTSAGGHANLGTTALSLTTWAAARLAMRKQAEENSGERLGVLTTPKYLLVPPDLEITALQILASEHDYTYALSNAPAAPVNAFGDGDTLSTRMQFAKDRVIVVDLWTDVNDWAAAADPRLYPTIGIGFRYGRTPEIFSVASPTAGLMFTNDTMPVKVRFFFATGPMDFRGLHKSNVA